jgi:hypothetical protein
MGVPKTADGRQRLAVEKTDTTKKTIISHDWTDPTTWIQESVRVVDGIATDSGDHLTYELAHEHIIDTYHGKCSQEDFLLDADGYSYRVEVKVNGVVKTEQDPHYGTGGDFTVDYVAGTVTFLAALDPSDVVTATYHYENGSTFMVKPLPGYKLKLEFVEVQFSGDVGITDSVIFQPYGLVDVFAPQLMPGVPSGTKIPLGNPVVYKAMSDYQNDAVKSYSSYPALGGNTWRGSPQPIVVLDWDYVSRTVLSSTAGMEIRLKLEHDKPFTGWYATVTFYCTTEPES